MRFTDERGNLRIGNWSVYRRSTDTDASFRWRVVDEAATAVTRSVDRFRRAVLWPRVDEARLRPLSPGVLARTLDSARVRDLIAAATRWYTSCEQPDDVRFLSHHGLRAKVGPVGLRCLWYGLDQPVGAETLQFLFKLPEVRAYRGGPTSADIIRVWTQTEACRLRDWTRGGVSRVAGVDGRPYVTSSADSVSGAGTTTVRVTVRQAHRSAALDAMKEAYRQKDGIDDRGGSVDPVKPEGWT